MIHPVRRVQRLILAGTVLLLAFTVTFCSGGEKELPKENLKLADYNGGFFSIQYPRGWDVITAGSCAAFSFLLRDPGDPLRQVFFFGEVGPVYVNPFQQAIDQGYTAMGGYPTPWADMPLVNPLTPSNFLAQFHLVIKSSIGQSFMPNGPRMEQVQVIATVPQASPIAGGQCELIRALFLQEGILGEGLFHITVVPLLPFTGSPGGGIGMGFLVTGITAPKEEFAGLLDCLAKCIASYSISESYVKNCIAQQEQAYAGIMKAGKTLSEASDIIAQGWEERNQTHDILSEKWSDAILGVERLYDPDSGKVYDFENGFYDTYDLNRGQYRLDNLQRLPEDAYELWMQPPLDGAQYFD